jgi:hypothetical protein
VAYRFLRVPHREVVYMSLTDIVVLAGLFIAAIFVIVWIIRRKKKGKRSCCS